MFLQMLKTFKFSTIYLSNTVDGFGFAYETLPHCLLMNHMSTICEAFVAAGPPIKVTTLHCGLGLCLLKIVHLYHNYIAYTREVARLDNCHILLIAPTS